MIYPENDPNAISINTFVREHHNELVIDQNHKVSRLIDSYDGGDDYYWVLQGLWNERHLETCVGGLIVLKSKIDDKDYEDLERQFEINGAKKA